MWTMRSLGCSTGHSGCFLGCILDYFVLEPAGIGFWATLDLQFPRLLCNMRPIVHLAPKSTLRGICLDEGHGSEGR